MSLIVKLGKKGKRIVKKFITPVEKDFLKITAEDIAQILSEVSLSAEHFHRVRQRIKEKI